VRLTDAQLSAWKSGTRTQKIAAAIAEWAATQQQYAPLPHDSVFGANLDFVATAATFAAARNLLVEHGVIAKGGWLLRGLGPFHVALQAPEWPGVVLMDYERTVPEH
jgi:hypothetical protein